MLGALARKLFPSGNERYLKALSQKAAQITALESQFTFLSDEALRAKTEEFQKRLQQAESVDSLLPEAFATVREAARRVLGQRPYDVQLIGGMVLHDCKIAEMKTGEGKTLVATLPVYLNALSGKGVHVVTVNDYLARRDSEWMGQVYRFLGLSVGCILHGLNDDQRRDAYASDVTYGTNNEFGFDYLRDNMKFRRAEMVQRPFHYAIVDEVDSILVDEARTPLIISGPAEDSSQLYMAVNKVIGILEPSDFDKDEKARTVTLTEAGQEKAETWLAEQGLLQPGGLYDVTNVQAVHHLNQALRAHKLFQSDVDYIVKQDKVIIIDEFTGRMMEGRRYSDGLHQALEAKEGVTIQRENQTLASITFQNYFRLYPRLAGMTGTAMTEATEFGDIYRLDVVEIPTNVPVARLDHQDEIYGSAKEKYHAIIKLIEECRGRGQPVLVGTGSIEKSETLSAFLKERKVAHNVLNARYHEQEASIIAQAGRPGAVTIATNMAGRGTDIKLGGNAEMRIATELTEITDPSERERRISAIRGEIQASEAVVKAAGGLYVIGTERHESRRIDNQLRGRSGRQGDPGASRFFLSLEDDLLRIFGADMIRGLMERMGLRDGEVIRHRVITRGLERAQEKVEARNYDIRKNLLRFDNVMNDQRKVIYEQRREIMETGDIATAVGEMRDEVIAAVAREFIPENAYADQWELAPLRTRLMESFNLDLPLEAWGQEDGIADKEIEKRIRDAADRRIADKSAQLGEDAMRDIMRAVLLQQIDQSWKDHLLALDHLRQGINLRAYGQRDPFNEYSREAFLLFSGMMGEVRAEVTSVLLKGETAPPSPEQIEAALSQMAQFITRSENNQDQLPDGMERAGNRPADLRPKAVGAGAMPIPPIGKTMDANDPSSWNETARNALCPCGSGKKYKHCHGKLNQ